MSERMKIMEQLDPTFARYSYEKRMACLYKAERSSFPKPVPRKVIVWRLQDPQSHMALSQTSDVVKTVSAEGITVSISLEQFTPLRAYVQVENHTVSVLSVVPESFVAICVRPRKRTFLFEYPSRLSTRLMTNFWDSSPPNPNIQSTVIDPTTRQAIIINTPGPNTRWSSTDVDHAFQFARDIQETALRPIELGPRGSTKGYVYFSADRKVQELTVRVFLGDVWEDRGALAFDVPFTLGKR